MEIDINQKKISIGDRWRIYIDREQSHFASRQLFGWSSEINLFRDTANRARYTIEKKWNWLTASYRLIRHDGNIFEFKSVSLWKLHYKCQVESDLYEIFGHKGRKYSIYKNDRQVAWWDKEIVAWFQGDNYKMISDKDADIELLISFCLIIDNSSSNDDEGNALTIDLGNIGPQARKFDTGWQPKT